MIGRTVSNRPYMYLPLKGDTNDYSTNAQNPTNTGVTTTTGQFGESNGAYEWADTTDRLEFTQSVGNDFASYINSSGATLFCFIKVNDGSLSSLRSLFNQFESGGTNRSFNIQFLGQNGSNENMYCSLYPGGSGFIWNSFYFIPTNEFKGVAYKLVKNGSNVDGEVFIDAVSVGTTSNLSVPKENSTLNTRIGAITGNSRGDLGKMHTFKIYNATLSDGALKILNTEKGRISLPKKLLLDSYSGAAVAYSLRKLRYPYNGYAIRVRRSSDNTEQDIGFVCNELDINSLNNFCAGTNGFVKTWYDQSGNGNNATQTTAANQPKIYDSSTGVLLVNNKPALFFDGSNDGLSHSAMSGTKFASFTVSKFETQLEVYQIIYSSRKSGSYSTFGASLLAYSNNTNMYFNTREGGSTGDAITYSNPGTNQILFSGYNDGAGVGTSNMKLFANGIEKGSLTNADPISFNASNYYDIGQERGVDPSSLHGYIQEVILYTSIDRSTDRIIIEDNINNYYKVY